MKILHATADFRDVGLIKNWFIHGSEDYSFSNLIRWPVSTQSASTLWIMVAPPVNWIITGGKPSLAQEALESCNRLYFFIKLLCFKKLSSRLELLQTNPHAFNSPLGSAALSVLKR
jgi:hypothetical protein